MNHFKKIIPALLLFCAIAPSHAVTFVYNLRIRRVFTIAALLERMKSRWIATAVPIFSTRSSHLTNTATQLDVREKRRAGGSLVNLQYIASKHVWFEATTAIETDHATFTGTDPFHASRTGIDDIVFSGGYRHFLGKKIQLVGYGLAGFPTRRKIDQTDRYTPLVGTRFFNIGVGGEISYSLFSELKRSLALITQIRLIHGFNRSWYPILPKGSEIQPGNVTDLLLSTQYRKRRTIFEGGYNGTFFTNQALLLTTGTVKADTAIRHTGYAGVSHAIFNGLFNKTCIIGTGLSVSYAHKTDSKTVTTWISGSIVF